MNAFNLWLLIKKHNDIMVKSHSANSKRINKICTLNNFVEQQNNNLLSNGSKM